MQYDYYTRKPGLTDRRGAGGVVVRVDGGTVLVALIKETEVGDKHYVLPKGGIEPGEKLHAAALREIEEEAGLTELHHLMDFGDFERESFDGRYWQVSHYALFFTRQREGVILDTEHHFDFGWFPIDALPPLFWRDEQEMIQANRDRIVALALAHDLANP